MLATALETGEGLTSADLAAGHPALAEAAAPGALQTLPGRDGSDGFFIAAIDREGGR